MNINLLPLELSDDELLKNHTESEEAFDDEEEAADGFDLDDSDQEVIEIAIRVAHRFLQQPGVRPLQIIGLGEALFALQRMPKVTNGVCCEFGVTYEAGTPEFNERIYIDFRITSEMFEINKGGHVYDSNVGGDSYSDPSWFIEAYGGARQRELPTYNLEQDIIKYLALGAKIKVSNESEIDYDALS